MDRDKQLAQQAAVEARKQINDICEQQGLPPTFGQPTVLNITINRPSWGTLVDTGEKRGLLASIAAGVMVTFLLLVLFAWLSLRVYTGAHISPAQVQLRLKEDQAALQAHLKDQQISQQNFKARQDACKEVSHGEGDYVNCIENT